MGRNKHIDATKIYPEPDRSHFESSAVNQIAQKYGGKVSRMVKAIQKLPSGEVKGELMAAVMDYSNATSKYIAWLELEMNESAHVAANSLVDRLELDYLRNEVARCHNAIDHNNDYLLTFTELILKR